MQEGVSLIKIKKRGPRILITGRVIENLPFRNTRWDLDER